MGTGQGSPRSARQRGELMVAVAKANEMLDTLRNHVMEGTQAYAGYFHALDALCKAGDLPDDWRGAWRSNKEDSLKSQLAAVTEERDASRRLAKGYNGYIAQLDKRLAAVTEERDDYQGRHSRVALRLLDADIMNGELDKRLASAVGLLDKAAWFVDNGGSHALEGTIRAFLDVQPAAPAEVWVEPGNVSKLASQGHDVSDHYVGTAQLAAPAVCEHRWPPPGGLVCLCLDCGIPKPADAPAECEKPAIVCLCGSTRFMDAFFRAGWQFTLDGEIVLSVGVCKHADHHGAEALGQDVADRLDELHLRKIDLADHVHILNVGGYIGESTRKELDYAIATGKPVTFLEPVSKPADGGDA